MYPDVLIAPFVLLLASLSGIAHGQPFEPAGTFCANEGDIRLSHNSCGSPEHGVLQICESTGIFSAELRWRYLGSINWSTEATKLACKQLELDHELAEWDVVSLTELVPTREINPGQCTAQVIFNCITPFHFPARDQVVRINCIEPATEPEPTTELTTTEFPTLELTTTDQEQTTANEATNEPLLNCNCTAMDFETTSVQQMTESPENSPRNVCQPSDGSDAILLVLLLILAVVLILVTIGWILSCLYFKKIINRKVVSDRPSNIEGAPEIEFRNPLHTNNVNSTTQSPSPDTEHSHLYDIIPVKLHNHGDETRKYDTLDRKSVDEKEDTLNATYHVLEPSPTAYSKEPQHGYDTLARKSLAEREAAADDCYHMLESSPPKNNELHNNGGYHTLEIRTMNESPEYLSLQQEPGDAGHVTERRASDESHDYHVLEDNHEAN